MIPARLMRSVGELRNDDGRQDSENHDDDQNLDEREPRGARAPRCAARHQIVLAAVHARFPSLAPRPLWPFTSGQFCAGGFFKAVGG